MKVTEQYEGVTDGGVVYHVAIISTQESSMQANDRQVGGAHYRSGYQHWDWVENIEMPYLLGCVTKYLTRWKEKHRDGKLDLEKAAHYLDKFIENSGRHAHRRKHLNLDWIAAENVEFLRANPQIATDNEKSIFVVLACWTQRPHLLAARRQLQAIIDELKGVTQQPGEAPRTDSNKHAQREMPGLAGYATTSPRAG